jgi:GNAT superfamily N-acetyltransferase
VTELQIRLLAGSDSLELLTELLHRAYASLAALGFNYTATNQDVETTHSRIAGGECYVVADAERIVATMLLRPPAMRTPHCAWYDRPDVAVVGQLGVEPALQRQGLGGRLIRFGEERARSLGATEVALDTAEGASHLIQLYTARGYRRVGLEQWKHANYRSVILSKTLTP